MLLGCKCRAQHGRRGLRFSRIEKRTRDIASPSNLCETGRLRGFSSNNNARHIYVRESDWTYYFPGYIVVMCFNRFKNLFIYYILNRDTRYKRTVGQVEMSLICHQQRTRQELVIR